MANLTQQQVKDIIAKAPEGTSPAGVVAALRAQGHTLEGYPSDTTAAPARVSVRAHTRAPRTRPGRIAEAGGTIGGLLGGGEGPLSIGAAGLGGMAGEVAQQAAEQGGLGGPGPPLAGVMLDPGLVGRAGAEQAAWQTAGGLAAKPIKAAGKLGVNLALKFTPEIAQTAIKEGVTATGVGLRKLMARIGQVGQAERKIVAAASGQGIGWRDPVELGRAAFHEVAQSLEGAPGREMTKLSKLYDRWILDNQERINPLNLLKKRQYYDGLVGEMHEATKKGLKVGKSVVDRWNMAMANQARHALQSDIPAIVDPGAYEKLGAGTSIPSELQKLRSVLAPVVNKGGNIAARLAQRSALPATGAVIGGTGAALSGHNARTGAFEGALAGAALDPAVASTMGLYAQNPLIAPILAQLFRTIGGLGNQAQNQEPQQ